MDVRIISDILHYCNKTIPLFKNFLNRILKSKSIIFNSHKTNILKKIKNELTWPLNKYFLLLIFSACLLTISITCLLQLKQFKTELKNQGEFIYKHTESKLQNYHDSLKTLIKLLLYKHSYLNAQKTTQIIKLAFVTEQHLQLLPLTWHSLSGSPKVYNHYGLITSKSILNVLRSNEKLISEKLSLTSAEHSNYFEIDREIDQFGEARLILYMPVLDKVKYNLLNTNNSKEQNLMVGVGLVGYLRLPVKISVILSELYDRFAVNDLLRLSNNSDIFYLSKSNDKYILNNNPDIKNFHFSDSFKLSSSDYSISIGKDFQSAFKQGAKKSIHYCGIIIIIGALFILIYNLFERRRIKNAYDEKFSACLISADMQTQELSTKLASKNQELALSLEQNIGYLKSNKALVDMNSKST